MDLFNWMRTPVRTSHILPTGIRSMYQAHIEGVIRHNNCILSLRTPGEARIFTEGNLRERILRPKRLAVAERVAGKPAADQHGILIQPGPIRRGVIVQLPARSTKVGLLSLQHLY